MEIKNDNDIYVFGIVFYYFDWCITFTKGDGIGRAKS